MSQRQNHQLQVSGDSVTYSVQNWTGLNWTELNCSGWTAVAMNWDWSECRQRTMAFLFHVTICVTFMRRLADRGTSRQTDRQSRRQGISWRGSNYSCCQSVSASGHLAAAICQHFQRPFMAFYISQFAICLHPLPSLSCSYSCSECVALQDPYCAWDKIAGKCRSHGAPRWLEENYFYQNVATGQHAACPSGELNGQYAAAQIKVNDSTDYHSPPPLSLSLSVCLSLNT